MQVLASKSYILDFIQYTKGEKKGLVNLDISFIEGKGDLKIQAVILDLLLYKDKAKGRLYPLGKHIIQLNNLFISVKLLIQL